MQTKWKKRYLQIVVTFLCLFMMGGFSKKNVQAASGYDLLNNVQTTENGTFTKDLGGWKYIYPDGTYPTASWKKIKSNIFYFNKSGYLKTGWKKYKKSWYYLRTSGKKKGMLYTGWKTISGKRYYLSKETGARVTGWQTIKNTKYYFDEKGVLQKGKVIDGYKLDAVTGAAVQVSDDSSKGDILANIPLQTTARTVRIFIGDSRTVGLGQCVGAGARDGKLTTRMINDKTEYYFAKVGSGYEWYSEKAVLRLKKLLKKNPTACVILNHGINDLGNVDQYISSYQSLIQSYPNAKFVIMSVNPVKRKLYKGYAKPAMIVAFNQRMQAAFPQNFVDTYQYLKANKYQTADGLHYDYTTYIKIYNYILSFL